MEKFQELLKKHLWFKLIVVSITLSVAYLVPPIAIIAGFVLLIYVIVNFIKKYGLKKTTHFKSRYMLLTALAFIMVGGSALNESKTENSTPSDIVQTEQKNLEKKLEEQVKADEETKQKEITDKLEAEKKLAETRAKKAEEDKLAKEKELAEEKLQKEAALEAARQAESNRIAEEAKQAEEAKLAAEEAQRIESSRVAEEARIAAATQQQQDQVTETSTDNVYSGGYTRDANGRWHRPNGQFASKKEIATAGLEW